MIAFVKWLIRYVKKDYRFLERYEKEHRHFFWFIGLDALVSALIAIVAFQILGPTSATNAFGKWLENSGPVGLTVDKFIDKVHNEHELAYWIGPMQGMQYTIDQTLDDMDVVTYLPKSSFDVIAAKPHLTIETFADDQTFARHLHVLSNVPMAKVLI